MSTLLVSADDFGLHDDIDEGILRCVRSGVVQSVSFSVLGAALSWSRLHKLKRRGVRVGLHLTLVHEPWATDGRLVRDWRHLARQLVTGGRLFTRAMRREMIWQVHACRRHGLKPDHLDSHQHVHVLPGVWPIARRLAEAHGIERLRVPTCPSRAAVRRNPAGFCMHALAALRGREIRRFLPCIGLARSGRNSLATIERELKTAHGRPVELVTHPGLATPRLQARYGFWGYDWQAETQTLLDPGFGAALRRCGYRLAPMENRA